MATTETLTGRIVPIRDPNRTYTQWRLEQIYTAGKDGPGRYVPNVGDTVIDTSIGHGGYRLLEVQFVDETTLLSELVELTNTAKNEFTKENRLLGIGPGYQSELWRLFLDTSVTPHVFIPDSRLLIYGTANTKYKLFQGTDVSAITGKVLSMDFNNNGEIIAEDIPLEKVAFADNGEFNTNLAVKCCRKGYTTQKLKNGEVVTLVTYNDNGAATSYNTLLVHNTSLDRSVNGSTKYITTIGIDSPFLDKTENNTLIFPSNIPRDALAMMGIISYSDGTTKRVPIDGNRMVLSGLDNYIPMKQDQNINLVLTYHLPDGEMSLNSSVGNDRFIAVKYFGRTLRVDGSYSVNLFPIPTYISGTAGWGLRYLLYTLDRDIVYDVTRHVQAGVNSDPFNPIKYNETQSLTVALDLEKVDPKLRRFRHVQTFKLALMGEPNESNKSPWFITYEKDQNPIYGQNIYCKGVYDPGINKWQIDVSCEAKTQDEWLDRLYYRTKPLYDKQSESKPPKPTHFTVFIEDQQRTFSIAAWNNVLSFPIGTHDGTGVIIEWTRVDGANHYQLGASPLCFLNISESGVIDHAGGTTGTTTDPNGEINNDNITSSTLIDIDAEVKIIADRGATQAVQDKYRDLLTRIKLNGLLKYEDINRLFQRIRTQDITPAMITNDVLLLEAEINKITISDFNRVTRTSGYAPPSMEHQR